MIGFLWIAAWLGCSSPPPTGPSAEVSTEAAQVLCKVLQGGRTPCTVQAAQADASEATVEVEGQRIGLRGIIEEEQAALGIRSIHMRIEVQVDGSARPGLTTPAAVYGGEARDALIQRGLHEWAVVNGVALADALRAHRSQPALRAVDANAADETLPPIGPHAVYRGWSLLQGTSQLDLAHETLLQLLGPHLEPLPAGWHSVVLRIDHEPGRTTWRCSLDGEEHEGICAAARQYAWPLTRHSRIQQTYVLAPAPPEPEP